jgi:carboxymethylenebutenolidase
MKIPAVALFALCAASCRPSPSQDMSPGSSAAPPAAAAGDAGGQGGRGGLTEEQFKALHEPVSTPVAPPAGTMVDLPGSSARAYLSLPSGPAPLPAVTVIHEWWGLNDNVKHWADRLAQDGYAALAVDLYGGRVATTPDEAMSLMKAVDQDQATEILLAAHRFLATDASIQAGKRGSIGWCFGGGQSLQLALAAPDLDACVIYYGFLVTDATRLSAIKAPICGVFGLRDQGIPPAEVAAFEAALTSANVPHEIHSFDAEHAFANPSGSRYDQPAATDAWEKVRSFLAVRLR